MINKKYTAILGVAAFLAAIFGFGVLAFSLHQPGLKTRPERMYYLPYQLVQAEQIKLDQARVPVKLAAREIEPGIYEHGLQIQTSAGERLDRIGEIGLDLSCKSDWKLLFAKISFQTNKGMDCLRFTCDQPKSVAKNGGISLKAVTGGTKLTNAPQRGILTIRSTGAVDLSVWVQKSSEAPLSPLLWVKMQGDEADQPFGSLSGWFQYSENGIPSYSKAQLLAYTWGLGVKGDGVIYKIVGLAFLSSLVGLVLLLAPRFPNKMISVSLGDAVGCSLIFFSICVIFSLIFPPFHGPDETNHFFTYTKIAGKESLEKGALELANKGCFQRIHRRENDKFVSRDALGTRGEEWPHYGKHHYPLDRSPLERVIWQALGHIMPHENAAEVMLQLRIINGLFVAGCLLLALAVAGSTFPAKHPAVWLAAPVLFIPCIAHYSTVVSNYPFLIGGYVIQMVVLGLLWASLDNPGVGKRDLLKMGALLGTGLGISLCSADNALVTLPFWGLIVPIWFMAKHLSTHTQESPYENAACFLGALAIFLMIICSMTGALIGNHSFLPERVMGELEKVMPFHGNPFLQGMSFLFLYVASVSVAALLVMKYLRKPKWMQISIPFRRLAGVALILAVSTLILNKVPLVPEIDYSRGGNTTAIKYACSVTHAFVDGLFPGKVDFFAVESFWRNLGWLDTRLPFYQMEILRIGMGIGMILLLWNSLVARKCAGRALFAAGSLMALTTCLLTIGLLYYMVLFNVNSRYILVAYLFAGVLAMQGYRSLCVTCPDGPGTQMVGKAVICGFAIIMQSWAWVTVFNRYF